MASRNKRPNILFALADDASHFGIYGHDFVKTPTIDSIAKEGVLFEHAFTSNPKCAPSRATILTGRYPWQLEEACNHFCYFPNQFPLLPDLMEEVGYHAGYTGKGWFPGDYTRSGLKRNPAGNEYNERTLTPPEGSKIRPRDYFANFKDFLAEKEQEQPFYFWFGCHEPHRKYIYGEGLSHGKSLDEITKVPPYWPDTIETRTDMLDYAFEIEWFDTQLGKMVRYLDEIGELDNTIVLVTSDNGCPFPRVKGQMYEQDFHLPMVAMYRNSAAASGRRLTDIINFVDIAPTFLTAAEAPVPEEMTGKSFLYAITENVQGVVDKSRDHTVFGREKHDVGRENDVGYPVRCIRNMEYLYIKNLEFTRWPAGNPETGYTNCDSSPVKDQILAMHAQGDDYYYQLAFGKRPEHELYHIKEDPECLHNLAESHPAIKNQMEAQLINILLETADPHLTISPDYFDKMELVSDTDLYSWKSYLNGTFEPQYF